MADVFIIGSKGIPAQYGGFESFVDNLTGRKNNSAVNYHVSCLSDVSGELFYNNARCFKIGVKNFGSARAVLYDLLSINDSIQYIKKHGLPDSTIYILACRIGPFLWLFKRKMKKMNIRLYINPDGHEWLRSKWNKLIRIYWKFSEKLMVKHADLVICDSTQIERYIKEKYGEYSPATIFIPYGADIKESNLPDKSDIYADWCAKYLNQDRSYYLIVGRFVSENNFETVIREFMASNTKKDLIIITNVTTNKYYDHLLNVTGFDQDRRIKFVGTVYDQELLKKIRENAYGYIHGHEVGGTNPSLLEALASTKLNILLEVSFNAEVASEAALYFSKQKDSLRRVIESADLLIESEIAQFGLNGKQRIIHNYTWEKIIARYERLFLLKDLE